MRGEVVKEISKAMSAGFVRIHVFSQEKHIINSVDVAQYLLIGWFHWNPCSVYRKEVNVCVGLSDSEAKGAFFADYSKTYNHGRRGFSTRLLSCFVEIHASAEEEKLTVCKPIRGKGCHLWWRKGTHRILSSCFLHVRQSNQWFLRVQKIKIDDGKSFKWYKCDKIVT